MNYFNAAILSVVPGAFIATVGYLLSGWAGLSVCSLAYACLWAVECWRGEQNLLRTHGASRLPADQFPGIRSLVRQLAVRSTVPMPALFMFADSNPQLMVMGLVPKRGSIAISAGLLTLLNRQELAAVIVQALHHLRSGESLPMTMAAVIANQLISVSNLFRWSKLPGLARIRVELQDGIPSDAFLWILIAPIAAAIIRAFVRPARQFRGDDASIRLIGDSEPLRTALLKLKTHAFSAKPELVSPATAHLFLYQPPFQQGWARMFQTQPSIDQRIYRLRTGIAEINFSAPGLIVTAQPKKV